MPPKLPRPDLSTLTEAQKDVLIMALFDQIDALWARVEALEAPYRADRRRKLPPQAPAPSRHGAGSQWRAISKKPVSAGDGGVSVLNR
jgi:hypothetical protein